MVIHKGGPGSSDFLTKHPVFPQGKRGSPPVMTPWKATRGARIAVTCLFDCCSMV